MDVNRLLSVLDICLANNLNGLTESVKIGYDRLSIPSQLDVTSLEPLLIDNLPALLQGLDCALEGTPESTCAINEIGNNLLLLEVVKDQGYVRDFDARLLPINRYNTDYGFARDDQECIAGDNHRLPALKI